MSWMAWMRWQLDVRQLEYLVLEVASRCRQTVLGQAEEQIASMSEDEAKGYLRAKSRVVVPVHAMRVIAEEGLPREMAAWIELPSQEEAIRQMLNDASRYRRRRLLPRMAA